MHFVSKLSDSDTENAETQVWLKYAFDCRYTAWEDILPIMEVSTEVGRILGHMMDHPEKWCKSTEQPRTGSS